jgi:RHS repeat-associated protein
MERLCAFIVLLLSVFSSLSVNAQVYTTYYHNDHLGSPVAATDERNELLWRAHYRPYGERQENPRDVPYGSPGYTGHVQDSSSGLVYMQARYYDPVVGRFLSIDPGGPQDGMPGSFNRYAYALNNPYRYVDPDGRWVEDAVIGVASVSIGAYSLGRNVSDGNWSAAAVDVGGLVLDGVAMALPGVPAAAGLAIQASRAGNKATAKAVKPDFIVSSKGTTMPTNKDYNLVDSNKVGGEWLQIHNTHTDAKAIGTSHTHFPIRHNSSTTREIKTTTGSDIDRADRMLKSGAMRERAGRSDKGGS